MYSMLPVSCSNLYFTALMWLVHKFRTDCNDSLR